MPLVTEQTPEYQPLAQSSAPAAEPSSQNDGTRQLLQSGGGTLAAGLIAAALTQFAFGGIGPEGPHSNSGWLTLIIAMMCLPFGFLLSLLGTAKWLRNRRLQTLHSVKTMRPR